MRIPAIFPSLLPASNAAYKVRRGRRYDRYVSPTGNDSAAGTVDAPWLTLGRVQTYAVGTAQTGALTLSATSGTVTATRSSGTFAAADVGKALYAYAGTGAGVIRAASGTNACTLEITSAFSSTSVASGQYYIAEMLDGVESRVYVSTGTYTNQSIDITRNFSAAGRVSKLTVVFGAGSTVEWNLGTDKSGFQALGANWTFDINGNGSTVSGFNSGTGNGFGAHNTAAIIARDWTVTGCVDGISGHNDAIVYAYDCTFRECSKGAYTHVQNTRGYHYRCRFEGKAAATLGIGYEDATCVSVFDDCVFVPATNGQGASFGASSVSGCVFGSMTLACPIATSETVAGATFDDCFVHQYGDARISATFTRCYGRWSMRVRGTASNPDLTIDRCVFVDSASTGSIYDGWISGNNDTGTAWAGQGYRIKNSVFKGYATAIGNGFSAAQFAAFNSGSEISNCCFYGNTTNINASITIAAGTVTADPLLGACNSTTQSDWAIGAGSPCLGAGVDGVNIGFSAADIS